MKVKIGNESLWPFGDKIMNNKKKLLVFVICYMAYMSVYIARLNLSVASPGMRDAGIIDSVQIGILGSVFSIVFAIGRLLNGSIGDKTPPWIMISTGLVLVGVSNIAVGLFPPFAGIAFLWMTNAFAQSMLWSSVLCVVSSVYDERKAKNMTSYMVTSVAMGNIVGILLNTYIITAFGINFAFIVPGAITLLLSTAVAMSVNKIKALNTNEGRHISLIELFNERDIKIMMTPALLHGVIKDNISVWMTVYFVDRFAVDLEKSALFVLFIPVIGLLGRTVYPTVYKLCREREHLVSSISFVVCAICALPLAIDIVTPLSAAILLAIIYAAVSMINTSTLSIFPLQFTKTGNVSSVSGVMDLVTYSGAGIGSFVYGFIIKHMGYSPMYASWIVISILSVILIRPMFKENDLQCQIEERAEE